MSNETNNGQDGGLLKGKPHYDKNGKPLGGIKAIVTDTGQHVELEGGEVIINKEASKKHWKELSKINQSAGGGVPIVNPADAIADTEEYRYGGAVHGKKIEFNPNHLPNKWVYEYAKKIKTNYPKVWALGGNEFGDEAFNNLERALERGHWTKNEEWMYVKWQSFNARHKQDFRIAGVIANLKWLNKVENGWDYMKNIIEKNIDKLYGSDKKLLHGGELKKGIEVEKEHSATAEKLYTHKINPEQAPKSIAKEHLKEDPQYYTKLNEFESKLGLGGKIYSAEEVWAIATKGGSEHNDGLENYESNIKAHDFYILKDIKIAEVLEQDEDVKYFVENEIDYYKTGSREFSRTREITQPIVIGGIDRGGAFFKNGVIDGSNRVAQATVNKQDTIKAFVPIDSIFSDFPCNPAKQFGVGGTADSSEDLSAPLVGGTMASSMALGGAIENESIKGITEVTYEDNGDTLLYGQKNSKTRISVKNSSQKDIEDELNWEKKMLEKQKADLPNMIKANDNVQNSLRSSLKEKDDSRKLLNMATKNIEILEKIVIPFYQSKVSMHQTETVYTYAQLLRPFDTGTYEKENFIRFVQDDRYNHGGYLEYSKPLSIDKMKGYDLAPISEVWKYDNKEFYYYENNKLKATVIENNPAFNSIYKNIPAIKVEYLDENNNKVDEEIFRGLQFMEKIASGKFTEVTDNTSEPAPEKEQYNYNKPLQRSDVDLVETFKNADNTTQSIKFEYNGGFFEWRYRSSGKSGSISITKYSNLLQLKNPLSVAGASETIYNTYNESQTTDLGKFLEFSIAKWNKDDLFGKAKEKQPEPDKIILKNFVGKKVLNTRNSKQGIVTKAFKPNSDSSLKDEPYIVDIKYDDGTTAINMPIGDKIKFLEDNTSEPEPQKEKSFKERINVEKTAENFKDIRQSLDEFFTPKWTAQIMFDLAIKHGFKGGSILEPSFGHGVFFDVAIENSSKTELGIKEENLYGFEIYKPNFEVVKKNHPKAKLFDHNFEYQFIEQDIFYRKNKIEKSIDFKKKQFDLVLGNPPYGKHTSPHSFYFDNKMQIRYEGFFIWLALQKVKQGGLVVFIINSLWLQNGNLYNHQKEQIAKLGDLIDAYRLPNKTFKDTDIATDIVVFRKK